MALEAEFLDLMTETVTHAAFTGRSEYGTPSYGAGTSYSCRITRKPTRIRMPDGSEAIAAAVVWIGGTPTIGASDQLTLPDGSTPPILRADRISDEDGPHHVKVYLG